MIFAKNKKGARMCAFFSVFSHKYDLSWWPSHGATAKHVHMQVRHGFTAVFSIINDDAETIFKVQLGSDGSSSAE